MAQEDPLIGAKAALKRTGGLAKQARETSLVPRPPAQPKDQGRKPMRRPAEQPKGMRSNVALRRSLSGGKGRS